MAVVPPNTENQQKVSLPRRIATYITSMNFAKVFRRHHPRESSSPVRKSSERPNFIHPRPFSYHIPVIDQSSPLNKTSNLIPYRIGLSSDSTLLANAKTNDKDEIVRLPINPKSRKDRRFQSQLNANKRWLFRSMETLDEWKDKVFSPKTRPTNSSQSRSYSVENLADRHPDENNHLSTIKQQRALSPNRSIEAITNRVINSIGIHRKSANSIPNIARSPVLTIKKQAFNSHNSISKQYNEINSSAILDFREISSLGFLHSRSRLTDENENISLTPSENIIHGIDSSNDENEEVTSNFSFLPTGYEHNNNDGDDETADSWDFSITWIDSLKEQHSPQRKIQFYENLIKLLEQDTLNIDELLVLRKVLAKIWPIDDNNNNNQMFSSDSKTNSSKSLRLPNKLKRRSKISTMTHHTAQRCSSIIEQSPFIYETLHEQNSGHTAKASSLLVAAKAKPYLIENSTIEENYPQHLNPFNDEIDIIPSAPMQESDTNSNDSIRRYFERLTLLETIYEKLNIESNKTPLESIDHHQQLSTQENTTESFNQNYRFIEKPIPKKEEENRNYPHSRLSHKSDANKITKKFLEMNVDGNGSLSSSKSSLKRRAPTAPHISRKETNHPSMFTLSSTDLNAPHEISKPILVHKTSPKERATSLIHNPAASCDDDGHVFVYDSNLNEEQTATLPRKTERIQQWLSSCERKEEATNPNHSPKTQLKMRCVVKPIRTSSPSPQRYQDKNLLSNMNEIEPGRFRSCLKIHLETTEPTNYRSRAPSAVSGYHHQQQQIIFDEESNMTDNHTLSPSFQRDHHAVFL